MDSHSCDFSDKESSERRNSNSEWLPTKCRITKPPPPKPASNPLQFVKVAAPSALLQKAQEHIKKVEEIRTQRHQVKEDAEEWQQNLDNWKSSRRKRQEHIIERVVEVKKLEQEGYDRSRRKSKTFNEMLEDRNKRGQRLNIPIYDDDSNDLSDYGIGSSSSKTNSVKDVDTDDSSSCLDDKDPGISSSGSQSGKDASSASNQSQSEDELLNSTNYVISKESNCKPIVYEKVNNYTTIYTSTAPKQDAVKSPIDLNVKHEEHVNEDYTYQKAIEDYRSKILPKLNDGGETIFTVKLDRNATHSVPKVEMYTTQSVSEAKKSVEVTLVDLKTTKRLPQDFTNSISVKERLKSLEKCADLQVKTVEKNTQGNSVKSIIKSFNKQNDSDTKNNNFDFSNASESNNLIKIGNINESVSLYLVDNPLDICKNGRTEIYRSASPEVDAYMNKLNQFNQDLDSYLTKSHSPQSSLSESYEHTTSSPSVSSTEIGLSSDRADSGIHTADVSCSVSQADESVEYNDILASTIPNCIEKLQKERERELSHPVEIKLGSKLRDNEESCIETMGVRMLEDYVTNYKVLIQSTQAFLDDIRQHISTDYESKVERNIIPENKDAISIIDDNFVVHQESDHESQLLCLPESKRKQVVYENIDIQNYNGFLNDDFAPLAPPKTKEPPREKPPPPPPPEDDEKPKDINVKRMNSTKRIKKEMHIKRSSFLGLDEPTDDIIDPVISIDSPPDINTFLQKESQLEKSLYRKYQDASCSSEVESQDSGLESERGRLSSDTWCSSLAELNTLAHDRQDSAQTNNSTTSEEDEIVKKEREIIALIEKEEESKNYNQYSNSKTSALPCCDMVHNNAKDEQLKVPYFPKDNSSYTLLRTDQDSEVLRVEHELLQLEKEELERQKENMLFRENKDKLLRKNRYSLENICDTPGTFSGYYKDISSRKSMPDLPSDIHIGNIHKQQRTTPNTNLYYKLSSGIDTHYRKSMPDIQQAYLRSVDITNIQNDIRLPLEHRKSLPELQKATVPYSCINRLPVMPGKPVTSMIREQRDRDKLLMTSPLDTVQYQNIKPAVPITRPGLNALSAVPKHRNIPNENWIQPKVNGDTKPKSYNKHWLYQEAELRRLAEQKTSTSKWSHQQAKPEQHIPEPIIQTLTQRVQNLAMNERNRHRRSENHANQINQEITKQHPTYLNRPHTVGHASPISYPPSSTIENSEGKVLSVSGKKKCSFCGKELGRGAAMIIESLCLCYHMSCFKCCVCHIQLGDGQGGTDVRVRNQKLHCHNCYTSDDGVKFSCV